jgi:SulP family sulfate permease
MRRRGGRLPIFQGLLPVQRSQVPSDIVAGITLATLAIPEVLGYTKIAGTPVITGLYTMLIPMALFAVFGSSRHLVVGADSATAAILAGGITGMAAVGSAEWLALAQVLALMSAVLLILARIVRLGFLADFLSRTVLVGFLTGVGVQIAIGEVAGMLGLPRDAHGTIARIASDVREIARTNLDALLVSAAVLAVILVAKRVSRKVPGALIAVIGAIAASAIFDLTAHGVQTLGAVPSGLPSIGLPDVQWDGHLLVRLLPTALAMFVVILAQSAATSRAYAARHGERFSENVDLVGLGLANIGAALSGTFVVNGSPTKTQMVDGAGGRSQLAQVAACGVALLVALALTGPLAAMPDAALSAVVFLIGLELIDLKGMHRIWAQRPAEFWVALITACGVVLVGVEQGIVLAMFVSLVEHLRRSYRSQNVVLAVDEAQRWHARPVTTPEQARPGLMFYRFAHTMYYANAQQLSEQVTDLVEGAHPPLAWFCIDASAVADVDYTAAETLRALHARLKVQGIRLVWANVIELVAAELDRYGLTERIGKDAFFPSIGAVLDAYEAPSAGGAP